MNSTNSFWNTFLWLSNTDPQIYQISRTSTKWHRVGLSLFVLLTGIFAFISSSFFVRTLFATYNETTKMVEVSTSGWVISVIIGVAWMVFIMNVDRMIIASTSKWMAVLRLPLAIAIGFVVAIPFEVQLFSGKINKALTQSSRVENSQYEDTYDKVRTNTYNEIEQLKATIKSEKAEMAKWKDIMEAETVGRVKTGRTGLAGKGPAYEEAKENYELHKLFLEQAQTQLNATIKSSEQIYSSALNEYKQKKIDQSYDFASQYQQFEELKEDPANRGLKLLANGITLLFILIEIIPALMKLLSENDLYDQLLKARAFLDEQTVNVLTNVNMEEIANLKAAILSKQYEMYQPRNSFPKIGDTLS